MEGPALQLEKRLAAAGPDGDRIAETLRAQRVQGVRHAVRMLNPIIRFVQAALPMKNLEMDLIDPCLLRITLPDGSKVATAVPQPVRDFLHAFNQGKYPELEMPS